MKLSNLKSAVIALTVTLAAQAQARSSGIVEAGGSGTFFVTNVDECLYEARDSRAPARYYTGLYLNTGKRDYDPQSDQRVYIWHSSCGEYEKSMAKRLVGKEIFLRLKDSVLSPGHWDLDIANHKSLADLVANAYPISNPPVSSGPIEFSNEFSDGPELVNLEIIGMTTTSFAGFNTNIEARSRSGQILVIDVDARKLMFVNSRGVVAFTQLMSSDETDRLRSALRKASSSCPVRVIATRSERRVTKVSNTCADLGSLPALNPAG